MLLLLSQVILVILAGVYAMRASSVFFVRQRFQLLMVLAALAFLFALVLFHHPPAVAGTWLYVVVVACIVGMIVNGILYFAPDRAHATPTNLTFSAVTGIGWGILAGIYAADIYA